MGKRRDARTNAATPIPGGGGGTGAALLLSALAAACGHLPPCPAAGGPAWTELESAHFRLRTDEPQAAARTALTDLEVFQAALLTVFGAPPDLDTGRLPVVVVDRGWTDFAPRQITGFFGHALFQPLVVMVSSSALYQEEVIKHELVHYFSAKVNARQPPWLSEGLASYYQTLEYDVDTGRVTVGRPPPQLLRYAQATGAAGIASMFAAKKIGGEDTGFYASAWIATHYLMNHREAALVGYQKALNSGASPAAAWTAAFGSQTAADLAAEIRQYLDGGQYALLSYRFAAPKLAAPVERRLTDADAHATRALLYLTGEKTRALAPELSLGADDAFLVAKHELDEALRQEPAHVASRAIMHFIMGAPVSVPQATAATQAHDGDWLAWMLMVDALRENHDSPDGALARAIDIARADRSIALPSDD